MSRDTKDFLLLTSGRIVFWVAFVCLILGVVAKVFHP